MIKEKIDGMYCCFYESVQLNVLTDVHVATDMRPEGSKGISLARDILCLNISGGLFGDSQEVALTGGYFWMILGVW